MNNHFKSIDMDLEVQDLDNNIKTVNINVIFATDAGNPSIFMTTILEIDYKSLKYLFPDIGNCGGNGP